MSQFLGPDDVHNPDPGKVSRFVHSIGPEISLQIIMLASINMFLEPSLLTNVRLRFLVERV